ncbi:hypothetical protein [Actinoplanes derwentensis]|uniref:Uncharacterized protein n=1 Tax=Actinoplanes derwentensis TaxID=113562 RepID=A0A1H2D2K6_9ACTN|nr:hypothetical protein [Actinoplanes derwentensis]SDT76486.1 hypothetical protein SAMN04489716_7636 [Actinoplanes derwentensis]
MNYRRYDVKPKIALWMLVAVADVAIIVASAGLLTVVLILTALAVIAAGGVLAARTFAGREPEPAKVVLRRRA